jgi:hypothetical protein
MIQRRQDLGFLFESSEALRVLRHSGQDLDGHSPLQFGVLGF